MKSQPLTLGAIALVAIALTLLAFFGSNDLQPSTPAAEAPQPQPASSADTPSATPSPTPSPSASPSPSPKPAPPPDPYLHAGSQGPDVLALQQKLNSLTYMTGGADGLFGGGTRDGVIAFQKTSGLKRTGELDPPTQASLATAAAPQPAYTTPAEHIEVDIAKQVVYVVRGGAVEDTLPTSTGSGQMFTSQGVRQRAITPNGVFNVYWKIPGWHQAPLGNLYKPDFFNGGIAFHGYYEVPTYPASHGCVRLPMEFSDWFYDHAAPYGETVYVYGGPNGPNPDPVPETSTATNAPEPAPGPSSGASASPTPTASAPPGCLNGLLGLACPVPSPTPAPSQTPAPSPTPSPTPMGTPTAPPTSTATP